jgi:hypothetical protein
VATLLEVLPHCAWLRELDLISHFRSTIAPGDVQRLREAWLSVGMLRMLPKLMRQSSESVLSIVV